MRAPMRRPMGGFVDGPDTLRNYKVAKFYTGFSKCQVRSVHKTPLMNISARSSSTRAFCNSIKVAANVYRFGEAISCIRAASKLCMILALGWRVRQTSVRASKLKEWLFMAVSGCVLARPRPTEPDLPADSRFSGHS
jgi:hypothetical protein